VAAATGRRRVLAGLALALTALAAGPRARAAGKPPRIGVLGGRGEGPEIEAFRRGLRELGWIEGQTVTLEFRPSDESPEGQAAGARELVGAGVDVLVVRGTAGIRAAQRATRTVPIVFVVLVDPVASGFVKSLARPGGNTTGLASQFEELITKQLELLRESLPGLGRIALLHHERRDGVPITLNAAEAAARSLGLSARTLKVTGAGELEAAFRTARSEGAGAVQVLPSPFFNAQRRRLIDLAARFRLPAIYEFRNYVVDGGLMSYGPSINEMFRRMASYVDRILKGARPGDLPIDRPATFELVLNLRTARALDLAIPPSILARADEVVE
jgi:putative ABC transport system substrate-binding protein